jgi:transcriptional regulator GlxA family with amidase domain
MQIGILDYEFAVPTSVTGPADIFTTLARNYSVATGKPLNMEFNIDLISENKGVFVRKAFGGKKPTVVGEEDQYDLVIIPAMFPNKIEMVVRKETAMIDWLRHQHNKNTELASICVGSFLLAATGLLNGRPATTNWMFADMFRKLYPEVLLKDDKIIVDNGDLYTCGGAFSFTTFMIYLIDKFCCREVAIAASKILMINMYQQPQTSCCIFHFQKVDSDDAVAMIQQYLEKNYDKPITMEELAEMSNMSPRNLFRRFEKVTSNTPLEYLQRYRIECAKKMLEFPTDSIERVALKCGYEDMKFFRKIFKRHVGMTPKEYKHGYSGRLPYRG